MRRVIITMLFCAVLLGAASPEWIRANDFYLRTEYQQSLNVLLLLNPKDVATLQLIGQDYFMLGEYKKATEVLERITALDPRSATAFHWLGRAYGRRAETGNPFTAPGYASKTRQLFEKSVELDPTNEDAINDLFDFYLQAPGFLGGGLHKAEALAGNIEKLSPAEGHYARAQIYDKQKEFDVAEQHLRRAIELAPRQVGRVLDLAKFLAKLGRFKESDSLFDQAAKIAPESPKILFERANTYIQEQRNLSEARELLERYIRAPLTPDDPPRERAASLLKKIGA